MNETSKDILGQEIFKVIGISRNPSSEPSIVSIGTYHTREAADSKKKELDDATTNFIEKMQVMELKHGIPESAVSVGISTIEEYKKYVKDFQEKANNILGDYYNANEPEYHNFLIFVV